MSGYPYRFMLTWVAALALAWLIFASPWSPTWNTVVAGAILLGLITAAIVVARRARAREQASAAVLAAADAALHMLPGNIRRNTALVLTLGDSPETLSQAFGDALIRSTDAAIWVRADDPDRLSHLATALKDWRNEQGPDAVACLVNAEHVGEASSLTTTLWHWRSVIGEAGRALGDTLPVCIAVSSGESDGPPDDCPWFGVADGVPEGAELCARLDAQLAHYAIQVPPASRAARMYRGARLDALTRWAATTLLPALRDDTADRRHAGQPLSLRAFGVIATSEAPVTGSQCARFITAITSLAVPDSTQPSRPLSTRSPAFPLPDPLVRGIAVRPPRPILPRVLTHGVIWLCVAFSATAAASAWQNRALVIRVMDNMARYRALDPSQDAARRDAVRALKLDRDELERHARNGVPIRLGLGFYRGSTLLGPVHSLIDSYQPPAPPPPTVELDSLSLFKSGSATLNPGSNRVMIGALDMVKAHPDKRVLVAGHTDSTGNAQANIRLSEARAASVRDWLADASGLPLTHFAIQGYGDTRPKATNDTVDGRAANRRVEITLVPDCRDERRSGQANPGLSACSFPLKE